MLLHWCQNEVLLQRFEMIGRTEEKLKTEMHSKDSALQARKRENKELKKEAKLK